MHPHITTYVPGTILLAGLACVSCSDVAPADATAPTSIRVHRALRSARESRAGVPASHRRLHRRTRVPYAVRRRRRRHAGVRRAGASRELQRSIRRAHGPDGPVGERGAVRFDDPVLAACPSADVDADPHSVGRAEQWLVGVPGRLTGGSGDAGVRVPRASAGNDSSWPSGPATIAGDRRRIGSPSTSESERVDFSSA